MRTLGSKSGPRGSAGDLRRRAAETCIARARLNHLLLSTIMRAISANARPVRRNASAARPRPEAARRNGRVRPAG